MSTTNKTLDEATVRELIDALHQRCPAMVFAALLPDDNQTFHPVTSSSGDLATCLGLASLLKMSTIRSVRRSGE